MRPRGDRRIGPDPGPAIRVVPDAGRSAGWDDRAVTRRSWTSRAAVAAAVAAWALAVRKEGRIPLYSTSWDNLASRSVARKLDLILYGTDFSID